MGQDRKRKTIKEKAAQLGTPLHLLKAFLLVVSTATSSYSVSETALGWWGGYDWYLDQGIRIAAIIACGFVDFLIIDNVFTTGYYLFKRSRIEHNERKEAKFAYTIMLLIGFSGIGLSLSTSYLGSKMLGAKFTPKVDTKEIVEANREEAQALAPYRSRRDSLEKALAKAIEYGAAPWAKCAQKNDWCKGKVDSVSTAQGKIFASKLKNAGVEIEKAQTSMAGTFAALRKVATSTTEARAEAEDAKVSSAYILLKLFSIASVLISILIIVVVVNVELAVSTTPPTIQAAIEDDPFSQLMGSRGASTGRQGPKPSAGNGHSHGQSQRPAQPQNHFDLLN